MGKASVNKVYRIVSELSFDHSTLVFSTKEKAKEYIKNSDIFREIDKKEALADLLDNELVVIEELDFIQ